MALGNLSAKWPGTLRASFSILNICIEGISLVPCYPVVNICIYVYRSYSFEREEATVCPGSLGDAAPLREYFQE